MRIWHRHKCPVILFGVGTSLEGQVISQTGGISLDTRQMNAILDIHEKDLDAVVQPGVTRTQVTTELRDTGLMFTIDPGADATMDGMASTRASGTNTVRYGTILENVTALEVVLPDGKIIETGTRARKSAAGYDLTHLFVGVEGTLGIISRLTVKQHGQPESILSATCAFNTIEGAVDTVILAIQCGVPMARIELLDAPQLLAVSASRDRKTTPRTGHGSMP